MADRFNVKQQESKFRPHSTGMHVAQCVDTINFGECVTDFPGKPKSLSPKCALVFRTGEVNEKTGEFIDIVAEYGAFMSTKAKLRALLESWRGRPYTEEQVQEDGIPMDKLVGKWAYLNIGQKVSAGGRVYAYILSANPVPPTVAVPTLKAYTRPEFLELRKKGYAAAAAAYRAEIGVDEDGNPIGHHDEEEGEPQIGRVTAGESGGTGMPDDDDLPF